VRSPAGLVSGGPVVARVSGDWCRDDDRPHRAVRDEQVIWELAN
jgi:hypothetical protein